MRAIKLSLEEIIESDVIYVTGENYHHLSRVCRLRIDQEVMILTSTSTILITKCSAINKKSLELKIIEKKLVEDKRSITVLLSPPKRVALEEIIRDAVELGVKKIILFHSKYSQHEKINWKRMDKIIEMAMIQSNNPFGIEIEEIPSENLAGIFAKYRDIFLFDQHSSESENDKVSENVLAIIGPEGGLSAEEIKEYMTRGAKKISLGPYILRSRTAMNSAIGRLRSLMS